MTVPFKTDRIHHVAYRCKDAKETVEWYALSLIHISEPTRPY